MGTVTAKQLKQKTGEMIKRVKSGERLIITYRGKPAAIMAPPGTEDEQALQGLRTFDETWTDIEKTLEKAKPRFKGWKEATEWARKQDLILVDTNIFVIDLRYKKDTHYDINRAFLDYIAERRNGFTTIVNLLEICGILSFNLNDQQLIELWVYFQDRYGVVVHPVPSFETNFPVIEIKEIFDRKRSGVQRFQVQGLINSTGYKFRYKISVLSKKRQ